MSNSCTELIELNGVASEQIGQNEQIPDKNEEIQGDITSFKDNLAQDLEDIVFDEEKDDIEAHLVSKIQS